VSWIGPVCHPSSTSCALCAAMVKAKVKKGSGKTTTTSIPDSHPVDAPLVAATTEETVPNWQPSPPGTTEKGVVQQAPVPTDRPVRVYADGE